MLIILQWQCCKMMVLPGRMLARFLSLVAKRVSGYGRNECRPNTGAFLKYGAAYRIDLRFECTQLIRHVD